MLISTLSTFSGTIGAIWPQVAAPVPPVALAMGIFDGIHKGHAEILSRAAQEAQKTGGIFGVLTFDPHPSVLFSGTGAAKLIIPLEIRLQRLAELGATFAICEPFTKEFASTTAEDFIDLLKRTIPTLASIHVGENFRFGTKRGGDVEVLRSFGKKLGIAVDVAPAVEWNGKNYEVNNGVRQTISSTRIREAITRGEINDANAMLSKPYHIEGKIIGGKKLGRQLGFPTLNLPWTYELAPRFGVYTVRAYWTSNGKQLSAPAVANFGIRPTVRDIANTPSASKSGSHTALSHPAKQWCFCSSLSAPADNEEEDPSLCDGQDVGDAILETFLLDPPPEIPTTNDTLRVEFVRFLRPEQHFPSLDALRSQLALDTETARQLFNV